MQKTPFPKMMGMMDVAEYLGVTRQYVDYLARKGELRFQKTSGGMVFLESDIKAFKKEWNWRKKSKD